MTTLIMVFLVKAPDFYIDDKYLISIENFIDQRNEDVDFLDNVAYYFDAKSHNLTFINDISIENYRRSIVEDMKEIRFKYNIY